MGDDDLPPDAQRCKRTDGRQWRCKKRVMDGLTLCEIHYLQGKHRQHKQKVPVSLKLERTARKKEENGSGNGECSKKIMKKSKVQTLALSEKRKGRCISEALDDALRRMKLKRGDLHLDLIRVFLKRQVEKKKEKEKEMQENALEEETRELPYGVLAISQSSSSLQNLCENGNVDVKIGAESKVQCFLGRHFRSKSIEPMPIGAIKVVPYVEISKKKKSKKCHFCRESKFGYLIKCLACRKRFFCVECIKKRGLKKHELKVSCPVCCGLCRCGTCAKQQLRACNHGESCGDGRKLDRKSLLSYLIYMLLPVLKKVNTDHDFMIQEESRVTGKEQSELRIPQAMVQHHTPEYCNRCSTSIVDYHRACTNCSYNLCLSCCREISQNVPCDTSRIRRLKKRKICLSGEQFPVKGNVSRGVSDGTHHWANTWLKNWSPREDGRIPCPPVCAGGCGESLLDLRCLFPSFWTRDLEFKADELLRNYCAPETADISSCCSHCNEMHATNVSVDVQTKIPRKISSYDNYIYCPSVKELHHEKLEHFQSHWCKGHPVVVRNVFQSTSGLCWDPVIMLCSYMESKSSEDSTNTGTKASNSLDWCEVEIGRKRTFMGSIESRTHASVQQKFLKCKAWLSSHLFQRQFPVHYKEILCSLPLPEYIHPVSGLLNVGSRIPKDWPKPEFGPSLFLSYGGEEELSQSDYLSKLSYESRDSVNILVYATDARISPEQISKIQSTMKNCMSQENHRMQSSSYSSNQKNKSSLLSEETYDSSLQAIRDKMALPKGMKSAPFHSSAVNGQVHPVANGNLSDDGESDSDESILYCGSIETSEDFDEHLRGEEVESCVSGDDHQANRTCGAFWDIFSLKDVPKLQEYLKRHSSELSSACNQLKRVHPFFDQRFYLNAYHKLKLKEEFDVEPWSFEQFTGEAIFIPAGCPYQIRKLKSCVNVVLDFISPENASRCVQLNDEIRVLPTWHNAKKKALEVEKMAVQAINTAIEDICTMEPVNHAFF